MQSPIGEYLLSPSEDPVILAVNDCVLRSAGRSRESLVGQRLFAAFPGNPDDPGDTGVPALRSSLARVIATGLSDTLPLQRYPIRTTRPDGSEDFEERYWRAINIPIHDAEGRLVCIAHRTEDVTDQARVADALRSSTDRQTFQLNLADALHELESPEEIALTASAMLGEQLGITRVTYVEVDDVSSTFVQRHWEPRGSEPLSTERRRLDEFGPEVIATLRAGVPLVIRDVEQDPRTAPHKAAYASLGVRSNVAIPLIKGGHLGMVLSLQHDQPRDWTDAEIGLAVDVAARTWSAAENARAQMELRDASRRKDEFLAMLAHELRNPLAPISTAAELLSLQPMDEGRLQRTAAIITRQVRHMTGLVDDLLDVSRVTRGLVNLEESPQDMKTIVGNAAEQVRPLIEMQGHQLTLALAPVPAHVLGDGKRMVQVLSNLLNNAAKYTPPGGHIQLVTEVDEARVCVHVKDDGIGIPKDVQPRIFELFAQAERTPDRSQGGLGLGLALVRSLVELHGGTVSVASDGPGKGSCFTVTLPRLPEPAGSGQPASGPVPRPKGRALDVLVVDDNRDAAETLQLLLESAGHRVRIEHDPFRALEAAVAQPPQAAIIDIGLPAMDGYELVQRLRARPDTADGVYIALTGYGQAADRAKARDAGFDAHLVKPATPDDILALLERSSRVDGR
ncbi:hybrid sensor histidine kinase/response regulator [Ramlibacter rhizophilus]|nr:ATP-binding protein [Ramlibacter rhizophilus]